jgi:ABC-type antimicrobial peptide transport system permease subunit
MTETLLLSLFAGCAGLAIAWWLPGALLARIAPQGSRAAELFVPTIGWRVFVWSAAVSLMAAFAFGLVPALRVTDQRIGAEVKAGQANSRRVLMPTLLSAQTIVSTIAIAIAGFILRSGAARNASVFDASPAGVSALVAATFGGVAVVLGAIGYFSMLEYLVSQRTREIGIRRALGAQASDIVEAVAVRSAMPLFRGLLIGAIGSAVIGVVLKAANLPDGIRLLDAVPYLAAGLVLVTSSALAAFWPTRRALRIEPQQALRTD